MVDFVDYTKFFDESADNSVAGIVRNAPNVGQPERSALADRARSYAIGLVGFIAKRSGYEKM